MKLDSMHLPQWLENNWLFRKIFVLRSLYFSKTSFKHYSQFAEDISIDRILFERLLLRQDHKGFFVDVGCFHPKKYNNTWALYKKGWRGINIDIDSIKIQGFDILRNEDTNIATAVSSKKGKIEYFSDGFYSLTVSLDNNFVKDNPKYIKKTTGADTLTNIIDKTKYKNRKIDLLCVDAEGHDLNVIKSLDFERYKPRLVVIETHKATLSEVENQDLYLYLKSKNYDLVGWCGLSLIMANGL